jgi:hypothetical protein
MKYGQPIYKNDTGQICKFCQVGNIIRISGLGSLGVGVMHECNVCAKNTWDVAQQQEIQTLSEILEKCQHLKH